MRLLMFARKIKDWIAPPVKKAEKRLAEARAKNAEAERSMTDLRDAVEEATARIEAERCPEKVPNGAGK